MAEIDSTKTCDGCTYFQRHQQTQMGVCRRYPTYQSRHNTEWCGEFSPIILALPVISIPMLDVERDKQQQNFISELDTVINKTIDEAIGNELPKNKGGRPRKVTRI